MKPRCSRNATPGLASGRPTRARLHVRPRSSERKMPEPTPAKATSPSDANSHTGAPEASPESISGTCDAQAPGSSLPATPLSQLAPPSPLQCNPPGLCPAMSVPRTPARTIPLPSGPVRQAAGTHSPKAANARAVSVGSPPSPEDGPNSWRPATAPPECPRRGPSTRRGPGRLPGFAVGFAYREVDSQPERKAEPHASWAPPGRTIRVGVRHTGLRPDGGGIPSRLGQAITSGPDLDRIHKMLMQLVHILDDPVVPRT